MVSVLPSIHRSLGMHEHVISLKNLLHHLEASERETLDIKMAIHVAQCTGKWDI